MDPLTLLRELFGEDSIRKVVTSGFDSVHKIAAATPESLAFFAGINEAVARQIVVSAGESLSGPPSAAYRGALAGSEEPVAGEGPVLPVKPRVPPSPRPRSLARDEEPFDPLDDSPLLDAGGILKSVAREPRPKELLNVDDLLEEVGLTDAEASFLEGISPWPGGEPPRRERASSAPLEIRMSSQPPHFRREEEKEVEYAPISDWSPERDPDPVPRLVRAPELGGGPLEEVEVPVIPAVFGQPEPALEPPPGRDPITPQPVPPDRAAEEQESDAPEKPSFWSFGR